MVGQLALTVKSQQSKQTYQILLLLKQFSLEVILCSTENIKLYGDGTFEHTV